MQTDEATRVAIAERNTNYQEIDPWADSVGVYLEEQQSIGQLPVRVAMVLERLEVPKERHSNVAAKRVHGIAEQLGWSYGRRRLPGHKNPSSGLWPDSVHTVHTVCTPRGARENASDGNASENAVHTVHPNSPTLLEALREQEPQQPAPAAPAQTPDTFGAFGVHGVHNGATHCTGKDLSEPEGCTAGCTAGCTEPEWHQTARSLRAANPSTAYNTIALELQTSLGIVVNGRQVREAIERDAA